MRKYILAIAALAVAASLHAQNANPTPDDIGGAISQGVGHPGQSQGLSLLDSFSQFSQALGELGASQGKLQPGTNVSASGFQVTVYSPLDWIAEKASEAAQQGLNFTADDVTPEMLQPVLHVAAMPSTPPAVGTNYGFDVSDVLSVVLTDASRKESVAPIATEPFNYQGLQGVMAEFSLDDLARLRERNPEFYVVVQGRNNNGKAFKVKKKHFSRLP